MKAFTKEACGRVCALLALAVFSAGSAVAGDDLAPDGHILTVNGGDGNIIEITPAGVQAAKFLLDSVGSPPGNGALFGLAFDPSRGVYFVDDNANALNLLH
jgi:hypothetical protein